MEVSCPTGVVVPLSQFAASFLGFCEIEHRELLDLYRLYLTVLYRREDGVSDSQVAYGVGGDRVAVGRGCVGASAQVVSQGVGDGTRLRMGSGYFGESTLRSGGGVTTLASWRSESSLGAQVADGFHGSNRGCETRDVEKKGAGESGAVLSADATGGGCRASGSDSAVGAGVGAYVPPWRRGGVAGGSPVEAVKAVGKWYARNRAARERRKRRKAGVEADEKENREGDGGSFCDSQSFFFGMPQDDVNGLKKSRLEAMKVKNEADRLRYEADVVYQQLRLQRLGAERVYVDKDVESGAYVNRLQYRNEAMDKKWQDQAENVQSYRTGPVRGWAETVVSGGGSRASAPKSTPTLSSGASPRSESDWELELKRRDDENSQLRVELQAAIAENERYCGCSDYDARNFNQPEHYGSTKAGDEVAIPWDQDPRVAAMYQAMRARTLEERSD